MRSDSLCFFRRSLLVAVLTSCVAGAALAHDAAAHAKALDISHYQDEIASMNDTVASIVADYEAGESVGDRVDALVDTWEHVDYHEAVETNAMPLYPPIWTALGGLRAAVDTPNDDAAVEQWQARIGHALHEGIGALKLVAARQTDSNATVAKSAADAGPTDTATQRDDERPAIEAIKQNLETVVERYRDGDTAAANKLLQQTYMQRFEGIEGELIEHDADLVTDLEKDFNATLPLLMEQKASANELSAHVETMNAKLDRAQTLLDKSGDSHGSVF